MPKLLSFRHEGGGLFLAGYCAEWWGCRDETALALREIKPSLGEGDRLKIDKWVIVSDLQGGLLLCLGEYLPRSLMNRRLSGRGDDFSQND